MKIYTKGGDEGEASLYNGQRRPKTNEIFTALGDVDELNSILGIAREHLGDLDQKAVEQVSLLPCGKCNQHSQTSHPFPPKMPCID